MIHETIHLITAKILGFSGFTIDIFPIGTSLKVKDLDEASPREDLIISLSGPMGNFFIAIVCYIINLYSESGFLKEFALYNIVVGIVNLIPAFPLDGGRILRDILCSRIIFKKANLISLNISIILGYILLLLFLIVGGLKKVINLDLLFFSTFILLTSYREKRRIAYIIMGYIIKKKEKLINRGYIENKSVSVYYKLTLLQLIELVDKNKYNVFTVLDEKMEIVGILYEEEVLNGLKELGNITAEELLL